MEKQEWKNVDKSDWPRGEWDDEPDKIQWLDEDTQMPCLIVRNSRSGFLCGYVGVDSKHPLFGKDYYAPKVEVHGGLTFADRCQEDGKICHTVGDGEDDNVWWFGFDCGHHNDFGPNAEITWQWMGDGPFGTKYRNINYVIEQCQSLAGQLKKLEQSPVSE